MAQAKFIAVWYQPVSSFATWKARGVTVLLGVPDLSQLAAYVTAAKAAGLKIVLQWDAICMAYAKDPAVVGWLMVPDEPNGGGGKTPDECRSITAAMRAASSLPIWLDLDGAAERFEDDALIAAYCAWADVVCFDYYPLNRGDGPAAIPMIGTLLDRMARLAPGRTLVPVIECSDQDLRVSDFGKALDATNQPIGRLMRGPTAVEFAAEVAVALAHGAGGLAYFPDKIGAGWEAFDGTSPDVDAAMRVMVATAATPAASPSAASDSASHAVTIDGVTYVPQGGR